jgi:transposase
LAARARKSDAPAAWKRPSGNSASDLPFSGSVDGRTNTASESARAWALKETAMSLYGYTCEGPARKHFEWWYRWAVRSRLRPIIEAAAMMKRRFANIITYLRHRITNAASESINAKIQWVKYTARGFRNKQNFINAIYFHCGGLDLAPVPLNTR